MKPPRARILVTGFRPFAGHAENPSERLARALADQPAGELPGGAAVRAAILDVAYAAVEAQFDAAVAEFRPSHVLAFGLDYGTDAVKLERLAVNLDDAAIPDERGELRTGTRIAPRGPAARWATLPLDACAAALRAAGVPVKFSAHAGAFLCNHLLYHALGRGAGRGMVRRAAKRGRGFRVGFVHLPPAPELLRAEDRGRRTGMDFPTQLRAGRALLAVLAGEEI